jgi:hypothetical protein
MSVGNIKKHKVNNHPMGENSPNLVTLALRAIQLSSPKSRNRAESIYVHNAQK